jgi:uncharacterized membrane protein YdfJ with MMPL/SSD domain
MTATLATEPSTRSADRAPRGWFARWGRFTYLHRKAVLTLAVVFVLISGVWGTTVFGSLVGGGFDDPGSESAAAERTVEETFGHVGADVVVVYTAPDGSSLTVDDPAFRTAVEDVAAALPSDVATTVNTYWSTGSPDLVSDDRRSTYLTATLAGADDTEREEHYDEIADEFVADGLESLRGGFVPVSLAMNTQVEEDIARAESLSIPLLLVLLVVVFGSLASASLPLVIGIVSILGSFTALNVVSRVTDVSIFAVNIVIMLGLGLAIDYALFVVSRFREELHAGRSTQEAVERTMATAGRTVAFSGLTVTVALGALVIFPMNFLKSMAYGGIASVAIAMIAAVTVLPALLGVLGPKVDALRIPFLRRRSAPVDPEHGAWARLAHAVMRRPMIVAVGTVALLLALGAPFLQAAFGGVDSRSLPVGTEARVATETLDEVFPGTGANPVQVVVRGGDAGSVDAYAAQLADLPGATAATVAAEQDGVTVIDVTYTGESAAEPARDLVLAVRDVPEPDGSEVLVGGYSAELVDLLDGLGAKIPWAATYLVVVTFILLFLAFGSVVLPIKAMAMNLVSLGATFGILVWGFQQGNLDGLLDFTPTGTLEATQPVLIFALAFGLSMDYEVFLLSRIREEWDRTGDNTLAVARGLQRSGGIITSAALLFVVVVGAFATSGIVFIQMIGIGLAVAVIVDATLVRALLVPATMRLLGRWNWYAPPPMARFWDRYGVREG